MTLRIVSCVVALIAAAPAAAQLINPDTCSTYEAKCRQAREERDRDDERRARDQADAAARAQADAKWIAQQRAFRQEMLRLPPLPPSRNWLLGSWRVEGGGGAGLADTTGRAGAYKGQGGAGAGFGELLGMFSNMNIGKMQCEGAFGRGVTFGPSSFSSDGMAGLSAGAIEYRGRNTQTIVAIPVRARDAIVFQMSGPDRVVFNNICALVRVGDSVATAAPGATPGATNVAAGDPGHLGAIVDGAAFRCRDGGLYFVSLCQGESANATCKLTALHAGDVIGEPTPRAAIAARVQGCEAGGIRYTADNKPVFAR